MKDCELLREGKSRLPEKGMREVMEGRGKKNLKSMTLLFVSSQCCKQEQTEVWCSREVHASRTGNPGQKDRE